MENLPCARERLEGEGGCCIRRIDGERERERERERESFSSQCSFVNDLTQVVSWKLL